MLCRGSCFTQTVEGTKLFRVSRILRLLVEVAITSTKFTLAIGRKQLKHNTIRQKLHNLYHIARRVGQRGVRPSVRCQAGVEKNITGKMVNNNKLLKCKKTSFVSSLNWTISSAKSIGVLTASIKKALRWFCLYSGKSHIPRWHWNQTWWYEK